MLGHRQAQRHGQQLGELAGRPPLVGFDFADHGRAGPDARTELGLRQIQRSTPPPRPVTKGKHGGLVHLCHANCNAARDPLQVILDYDGQVMGRVLSH